MKNRKKVTIRREVLLVEKPTGKYSCPNYLPPEVTSKILDAFGLEYDEETKKKFAEVIENFGIEIVKSIKRKKVNKEDIEDVVMNIEIT